MPTLLRVFALTALIVIPGRLARGVLRGEEEGEELLLFLFQVAALGQMIVGLWGILLASIGRFTPTWVTSGSAVISLGLFVANKRRLSTFLSFPRLELWQGVALGALLIGCIVFARPHENLVVGRDPGVYANTAIHLARTGQWLIRDPFFVDLPVATQKSFLSYVFSQGPFRLPGFFWLPDRGIAVSQFLPFFTVWMALLEWTLGSGGGLWAALLFTSTGALGLLALAARFWKPRVALILLPLLLTNPGTIWYARSANSEVALQVLVLLLVSLWMGHDQHEGWFNPLLLAGTVLAALLDKLDTLYLLPIVFMVFGLAWLIQPQDHYCRRVAVLMPIALGLSALYIWRFAWPYVRMSFQLQARDAILWFLLVALGMLVMGAFAIACLKRLRQAFLSKSREWAAEFAGFTRLQLRIAAVVIGVSLIVYYVVLPATVPADQAMDKRLSLVKLGWYVTPVGLVLSSLGVLSLFRGRPPNGSVLLLLLMLGALFINLAIIMVDHIFGIRRFVSVAMPGLLLFSSGGLGTVASWRLGGIRKAGIGLPVVLGGLMLIGQMANSRILVSHREFEGVSKMLERVGHMFAPESVVVFPDQDSLLGTFMGPNLWLGHDLEPLYASRPLSAENWQSVQKQAREEGRPLYAINEKRPPILSSASAVALSRISWHIPELERTAEHFPRQIDSFDFEFTIWHITEGDGTVRYEPSALLSKVGKMVSRDDGAILQGQGAPGYLCYGPYHQFPPGPYVASFMVVNSGTSARTVELDIAARAASRLAWTSVDVEPTDEQQMVQLQFLVESSEMASVPLEFRVFLPEGGQISLAGLEIVPVTTPVREDGS